MQLWNFAGERLATLPGVALPGASTNNTIYVSNPQDLMFVYCPPASTSSGGVDGAVAAGSGGPVTGNSGPAAPSGQGCIRVFDLQVGRQVALVQQQPQPQQGGEPGSKAVEGHEAAAAGAAAARAAEAALQHVTGLYYDGSSHRLYTGTADGKVQAWAI